jgi:hypothetical protein
MDIIHLGVSRRRRIHESGKISAGLDTGSDDGCAIGIERICGKIARKVAGFPEKPAYKRAQRVNNSDLCGMNRFGGQGVIAQLKRIAGKAGLYAVCANRRNVLWQVVHG